MNDKHNHMKNRQRGRNNGKPRPMGGGGGGRNPNFDGGNRPRGNAQQLMEKFLAMARDASSAGDRVMAENYYQHADHYYRVLNARFEQQNGQGHQQGASHQGGGQQHHNNQQHNNQHQGHGQQHNNGRPQYQANDDNRGNQIEQPQDQSYGNQPQQAAPQQVNHAPAPQPQPAPAAQHDGEIGLPPGILGVAPPVPGGAEAEEAGEGDTRRPQQGRRRRGPPRERAGAGE